MPDPATEPPPIVCLWCCDGRHAECIGDADPYGPGCECDHVEQFVSEWYRLCDDPDCTVAFAYRDPFPTAHHWHYVGAPAPQPDRWADR